MQINISLDLGENVFSDLKFQAGKCSCVKILTGMIDYPDHSSQTRGTDVFYWFFCSGLNWFEYKIDFSKLEPFWNTYYSLVLTIMVYGLH